MSRDEQIVIIMSNKFHVIFFSFYSIPFVLRLKIFFFALMKWNIMLFSVDDYNLYFRIYVACCPIQQFDGIFFLLFQPEIVLWIHCENKIGETEDEMIYFSLWKRLVC